MTADVLARWRLALFGPTLEAVRDEQQRLRDELRVLDPTDALWREALETARTTPLSLREAVSVITAREHLRRGWATL